MFDCPILRNLVLVDGVWQQAAGPAACAAAAEAGGGVTHPLGVYIQFGVFDNYWHTTHQVLFRTFFGLALLHDQGVLSPGSEIDAIAGAEFDSFSQDARSAILGKNVSEKVSLMLKLLELPLHPVAIVQGQPGPWVPPSPMESLFKDWAIFQGFSSTFFDGAGGEFYMVGWEPNYPVEKPQPTLCFSTVLYGLGATYDAHATPEGLPFTGLYRGQPGDEQRREASTWLRAFGEFAMVYKFGREWKTQLPWAHRVVLVSRQTATARKFADFAAVHNTVRAEALKAGFSFSSVEIGNSNIKDQMMLFASSRVLVFMHGSAMANTLYSRPGTSVVYVAGTPDGIWMSDWLNAESADMKWLKSHRVPATETTWLPDCGPPGHPICIATHDVDIGVLGQAVRAAMSDHR